MRRNVLSVVGAIGGMAAMAGVAGAATIVSYDFNNYSDAPTNQKTASSVNTSSTTDLTLYGSAALAVNALPASRLVGTGPSGLASDKAFSVAGTGSRAVQSADNAITDGLTSFTLSLWFNSAGFTNGAGRYIDNYGASGSSGIRLYQETTGKMTFSVDSSNINFSSDATTGGPAFSTGTWYFVALSYNGSLTSNNLTVYTGGTTGALSSAVFTANAGIVGDDAAAFTVGNRFDGERTPNANTLFDNVRLDDTTTSAADVLAIRNAAIPEPASAAAVATLATLFMRRRRD